MMLRCRASLFVFSWLVLAETLLAQPDTLRLSQLRNRVYLHDRATVLITPPDTPWPVVRQHRTDTRLRKGQPTTPHEAY